MIDPSEQTVLVTGGAGFIGSALSRTAAGVFGRWVAVDSLHRQVHQTRERPRDLHEDAELVVADVTDATAWDALLRDVRPDIVVHLAAETGTAQSLDEATRHAHVNVTGTTRMLDAFGSVGHVPKRIVLSSSRAVYGEGGWRRQDGTTFRPGQRTHAQLESGRWDFEGATPLPSSASTTWPSPTSVYGSTKLAQEHVLESWAGARGSELAILRFQNVYGPGQSLINSYTGIVSLFSQLARRGESIPVYEDGAIVRDFVFIEDVADSLVAAMTREGLASPARFDIGSGRATTILELAETIARFHGAPAPHITGAFRDGDVRYASALIDVADDELQWRPRWSLDDGVAALQAWIAAQG